MYHVLSLPHHWEAGVVHGSAQTMSSVPSGLDCYYAVKLVNIYILLYTLLCCCFSSAGHQDVCLPAELMIVHQSDQCLTHAVRIWSRHSQPVVHVHSCVVECLKTTHVKLTGLQGKKKRKQVDRRASKGRKLRYHIQDKLVNFMAPVEPAGHEIAAQLFGSLFGGVPQR